MKVKNVSGTTISVEWNDMSEVGTNDSSNHSYGDTISSTEKDGEIYFDRNGAKIADLRKMIRDTFARNSPTSVKTKTARLKRVK